MCHPPLNLSSLLLPLHIEVNGRRYQFRQIILTEKLLILSVTLKSEWSPSDSVALTAPSFSVPIELIPPVTISEPVLVTMQKNNKVQWIKDWITYYQTAFGIKEVFIYDNSSNNQDKLAEELHGEATIVKWNSEYGPSFDFSNSFSQIGALNHFKHRYASNCTIFNFDVDELLVVPSAQLKKRILSGEYLRFNGFVVPFDPDTGADASFRDFVYREKTPQNMSYKYVFDSSLECMMSVHRLRSFTTPLWKKLFKDPFQVDLVPLEEAYFLHYYGITTNWKSHVLDRFNPGKLNTEELLKDTSVKDFFDQIR